MSALVALMIEYIFGSKLNHLKRLSRRINLKNAYLFDMLFYFRKEKTA